MCSQGSKTKEDSIPSSFLACQTTLTVLQNFSLSGFIMGESKLGDIWWEMARM